MKIKLLAEQKLYAAQESWRFFGAPDVIHRIIFL